MNVDGLGDVRVIEELGEVFGLHRLALEDVVNTHQRAKVEAYGDVLFIVARMADVSRRTNTEQLSMFVASNFVVTLQEEAGDCWNSLRERIRQSAGRIRQDRADYLAYLLLDAVIDDYFPLLETIGDDLGELEEATLRGSGRTGKPWPNSLAIPRPSSRITRSCSCGIVTIT
jgi:magnesium transporter